MLNYTTGLQNSEYRDLCRTKKPVTFRNNVQRTGGKNYRLKETYRCTEGPESTPSRVRTSYLDFLPGWSSLPLPPQSPPDKADLMSHDVILRWGLSMMVWQPKGRGDLRADALITCWRKIFQHLVFRSRKG